MFGCGSVLQALSTISLVVIFSVVGECGHSWVLVGDDLASVNVHFLSTVFVTKGTSLYRVPVGWWGPSFCHPSFRHKTVSCVPASQLESIP